MSAESETPFDSIEGSYQYVDMLADAIEEARRREVEEEVAIAEQVRTPAGVEARACCWSPTTLLSSKATSQPAAAF